MLKRLCYDLKDEVLNLISQTYTVKAVLLYCQSNFGTHQVPLNALFLVKAGIRMMACQPNTFLL
jgi:hypothetical protein